MTDPKPVSPVQAIRERYMITVPEGWPKDKPVLLSEIDAPPHAKDVFVLLQALAERDQEIAGLKSQLAKVPDMYDEIIRLGRRIAELEAQLHAFDHGGLAGRR